jgi:putative ABC transport system permease protein
LVVNPLRVLFQPLPIAVRAIFGNKLRALLTTLGIVIGVAAVIAMMAVGAGAKMEVEAAFAAMGTNILVVLPGSSTGAVQGGYGSRPTVTWEDLDMLRQLETVEAAVPMLRSNMTIVSQELNWTTNVTGTEPLYFDIRDWPFARGGGFTSAEVEAAASSVVLGKTVADRLFGPNADPVGRTVRIKNMPFRVVGVAAKKGQASTGQDYDDAAFIPYTTFGQRLQGGLAKFVQGTVLVQARSAAETSRAEFDVRAFLRDRHRLPPDRDDDFSLRNLSDIAGAQQQGTDTMTLLLASVAAISLVVGGIGIMNIMLVDVTERTREIGLRMALGAAPGDILAQFLVEAVALSLAGGAVGIGAGVAIAGWIASEFHWLTAIDPHVIVVAVGFSALVGVAFGVYPARKASRLDPIEALRFE